MGKKLILFGLILLFSLTFITYSQLGEVAGQPFFNVSLGSSETLNYTIINSGSTPIGFKVIPPSLNTIPHNATPTVVITPMNGTLAPNSQQKISITVYMPSSDKPGLKWQGITQVLQTSTQQINGSGMGVTLREGVAKIVTIESAPPKPLPLADYVAGIVLVIAVVVIVSYIVVVRRKAKTTTRITKSKVMAKKVRAKVTTKKPKRAKDRKRKARKATRKRTTRKRSRKSARTRK